MCATKTVGEHVKDKNDSMRENDKEDVSKMEVYLMPLSDSVSVNCIPAASTKFDIQRTHSQR